MNILALDTSTEVAGIALLEGERVRFSHAFFHRMDLSQRLLPAVRARLQEAGMALADVEALGVGLGPGSFTGVRIGVTTGKVLAQATGLPLVGIGTLAVMAAAFAACRGLLVCPCLDARKREVYAALYRVEQEGPRAVLAPHAVAAEVLAQRLAAFAGSVVFCGTGAARYEAVFRSVLGARCRRDPGHDFPDPVVLAHLARGRLARGDRDDPLLLTPIYARPSEAERSLARAG